MVIFLQNLGTANLENILGAWLFEDFLIAVSDLRF